MELGYSPIFLILIMAVGLPLALLNPNMAFLVGIVLVTGGNVHSFNATRVGFLGPFLNLNDACELVVLTALLVKSFQNSVDLKIPLPLMLLVAAVGIGAFQSFLLFGATYENFRSIRWAIDFPLAFWIGYNFINEDQDCRLLVYALLIGASWAVFQHFYHVIVLLASSTLNLGNYSSLRTISYSGGGIGPAFFLAAIVMNYHKDNFKRLVWYGLCLMFVVSIFLTQTRSQILAFMLSAPLIMLILKPRRSSYLLIRSIAVLIVVFLAINVAVKLYLPDISFQAMIFNRLKLTLFEDPDTAALTSRLNQFDIEIDHWAEGVLILGRGLYFFQKLAQEDTGYIAFGHLGYVTYLAQLGIIGLFIYGFYLPYQTLKRGAGIFFAKISNEQSYLGLLSVASVLYLSIMFIMSSNFLALGYFAPGVLWGATWRNANSCKVPISKNIA